MGVPAFFRWLSRKYPSIVVHCVEEKLQQVGGVNVPVDASKPNPNEVEFDNLYLDMNGIIHPCCHPEDRPAPENEDEMMVAIFEYIDRIFNLVRPRKLLYMAIDGVAPRAKMNQQRSRRFRSAKDSFEKLEDIKRIRQELRENGVELPPLKPDSEHFDSNCITPGTPFMAHLSVCLMYYIHDRMNKMPAWQNIKIILSDGNVPGEGEHKIMDYIRKQRASPAHDPNTHHCLCGADADLIMLGLATHEPYFTILREEFKPNTPRPCEICNQIGHSMKECTGEVRVKQGAFDELTPTSISLQKDFIFIRISVLREYLQRDLKMHGTTFKYDFERAVDDWVFMCFFVGNDFLPHLPSLQIREGAIDRLIKLYKEVIESSGGYLTRNGYVDVARVRLILSELGTVEDEIFRNRRERDMMEKERRKFKKRRQDDYKAPKFIPQQLQPVPIGSTPLPAYGARRDAYQMRKSVTLSDNQEAAKNLKSFMKKSKSQDMESSSSQEEDNVEKRRDWKEERKEEDKRMERKRKQEDKNTDSDTETEDEIRLWEEGWKDRYYETKFDVACDDIDFVRQVVESYMEGLCWVMAYYYQGCPSWKWFFPFHYAPFASDFRYTSRTNYNFEKDTKPFKPLEQLMGVFPAASCKFLPPAWQELMLNDDSHVIDFYPSDFKIDLNGKKFAWQGVALLPFVNERRLLSALEAVYDTLTDDECFRNALGCDFLFFHKCSKLYPFVQTLYEHNQNSLDNPTEMEGVIMNPDLSGRISGEVWVNKKMTEIISNKWKVESPLPTLTYIHNTCVISVNYHDPQFSPNFEFEAKILEGVVFSNPTLKPEHFGSGRQGSYNPQIGFSQRHQHRQYGTPDSTNRMIRHSLNDGPRSHHHGNYMYPPPSNQSYSRGQGHWQQQPYGEQSYNQQPPHHYRGPPSSARWTPLPPPRLPTHSQYMPRPPQPSMNYQQHQGYDPRHQDHRLNYGGQRPEDFHSRHRQYHHDKRSHH